MIGGSLDGLELGDDNFEDGDEGEEVGDVDDREDEEVREVTDGSATATRQGRRRVIKLMRRMPRDQMSD